MKTKDARKKLSFLAVSHYLLQFLLDVKTEIIQAEHVFN